MRKFIEVVPPCESTAQLLITLDAKARAHPYFVEGCDLLGLSTNQISPLPKASDFSATFYLGGSLLKVSGRKRDDGLQPTPGKRTACAGFSDSSRRNLMRKMATVDRRQYAQHLPLFLTLTYPGEWPGDPKVWKKNLDNFLKRLGRHYESAFAIWKLEPQKRGAPHFHLIVFNESFIDKDWLSRAWFEVVGSGDERHLRAGTQVKQMRSWRGVMSYAAKYVGKQIDTLPPGWESVGRFWGIHNREGFKAAVKAVLLAIPKEQFYAIREFLWRESKVPVQKLEDFMLSDFCGWSALVDWEHAPLALGLLMRGMDVWA